MVEKTRHRKFPETVSWPETVGCKGVNLCISYDSQNRRVYRKADEDQSGSQETELYYVLDGNRVIEERVYSDEDLKRDYWYGVYIDEPVFARCDLNDDNDFSDTDEEFYYLHNTQYSVHAIIDTSGNIIEVYKNYQPYGAVSVYTGDGGDSDWFDGDETTGSLTGNYYLFTGRRYDPEADLMFYRNRMYSTSRGRFLQRDPVGYEDGLNLYRAYFVPWGIDPLGLEVIINEVECVVVEDWHFAPAGTPEQPVLSEAPQVDIRRTVREWSYYTGNERSYTIAGPSGDDSSIWCECEMAVIRVSVEAWTRYEKQTKEEFCTIIFVEIKENECTEYTNELIDLPDYEIESFMSSYTRTSERWVETGSGLNENTVTFPEEGTEQPIRRYWVLGVSTASGCFCPDPIGF